jgi:uncharacterized membrane protein
MIARLAILLVTRRWGLIIIGAILVIAGVVWGVTSHQVSYTSSNDNAKYDIGKGEQSGNVYIHVDNSDEYYAAFASDFTVPQSDIDNSVSISFIARSDTSSLDPNLNAPDGTTISDAHKIEKLVFYDNNGKIMDTFTTSEYNANPNGFYENNWLKSIWLAIAGVIVLLLALFVPMFSRKQPATASFSIGQQPQQPYGQPGPQPQQPYGQEYQSPQQYPQYGQPGNPSQQPPQR